MTLPAFRDKSQWKIEEILTVAESQCKTYWSCAKKTTLLWLGKVSITGRILCENRRPEIFTENESFLAKTGGLESLHMDCES